MSYDFIMDSFAWIEYFRGSKIGKRINELLITQRVATPTIVLAEINAKLSSENDPSADLKLRFISSKTTLLELDFETSVLGGELKTKVRKKEKNDFGQIDAIIYAHAMINEAKVITGDHHFKPLPNVLFLEGSL